MKKIKLYLVSFTLLFVSVTFVKCEMFVDSEYDFPFYNDSDDTIYTCITNCYPDTVPNADFFRICRHKPKSTSSVYTLVDQDPTKAFKNKMFCVFILDKDTVKKYDFNTIRLEYKVIQRYDLNGNDFANYRISYPPNSEMITLNMYPPYKQYTSDSK